MDNQYVAQAQAAYQASRLSGRKPGIRPAAPDPSVPKGPGDLGVSVPPAGQLLCCSERFRFGYRVVHSGDRRFRLRCRGRGELQLAKRTFSHDYENAMSHFEIPPPMPTLLTKAYLGMGNAL